MGNITTYLEAEKYLQNKQVFFKKEIVNIDFKTIAKSGKVHEVYKVNIKRLNETTVLLYMQIDDQEAALYENKTDQELFAFIKSNFIPVPELANFFYVNFDF